MRRLVIIGAGGHGRVIAETASLLGLWKDIVFADDRFPDNLNSKEWAIIGNTSSLDSNSSKEFDVAVGVGDNEKRLELVQYLNKCGFNLVSIIHPTAFVSPCAKVRTGVVIFANAVVNNGAVIGSGCIVNTSATVDHDCILYDGVHISPGAHLAGGVTIGSCSWIGVGASVIQGLNIGSDTVVGAGAVIINDIPNSVTVVGCPGKVIKERRRVNNE